MPSIFLFQTIQYSNYGQSNIFMKYHEMTENENWKNEMTEIKNWKNEMTEIENWENENDRNWKLEIENCHTIPSSTWAAQVDN